MCCTPCVRRSIAGISVSGTNRPPNGPKRPFASGSRPSSSAASNASRSWLSINSLLNCPYAGYELFDLGGVFDAARTFNAARHVDSPRFDEAHGIGDVVGGQATGEDHFRDVRQALRFVPVREPAGAAVRAFPQQPIRKIGV